MVQTVTTSNLLDRRSRTFKSRNRKLQRRKKKPKATKKKKQNLCLDAGYVGDEVQELAEEFEFTLHVRPRGEEAQELKRNTRKKARRWVVERTHSWMNRFRGILIRWSKRPDAYIAMLHLVCGIITWRATGLMG